MEKKYINQVFLLCLWEILKECIDVQSFNKLHLMFFIYIYIYIYVFVKKNISLSWIAVSKGKFIFQYITSG